MARKRKTETADKEHSPLADKGRKLTKKINGDTAVPKAKKEKRSSAKVIVSEYFSGDDKDDVSKKKLKFLKNKIDKTITEDPDEPKNDKPYVDDFEEASVKYRSPVRPSSRNNKQKLTHDDKKQIVNEKQSSSRKRKCKESDPKDPATTISKKPKRSCKDIEEKLELEKNSSTVEINGEDKKVLQNDKKSRGKRKNKVSEEKEKSKLIETSACKEGNQEIKQNKFGAKRKQSKCDNVKNDKHHGLAVGKSKKEIDSSQKVKDNGSVDTKVKSKKESIAVLPKTIDHTDVTAILLHMEGAAKTSAVSVPSTSKLSKDVDDDDVSEFEDSDDDNEDVGGEDEVANTSADKGEEVNSDDSEEEDWEEVEDHHGNSPKNSQIPDKPVEFTLDAPLLKKKRKKGGFDWATYLKRKMNRFKKEIAMEIHKVHLLCLTARTIHLHNVYQDIVLQAQTLSIILETRELSVSSVKKCTSDQLGRLFSWIQKTFVLCKGEHSDDQEKRKNTLRCRLENSLQSRAMTSHLDFVSVCVLLLRQLGFNTRLMMSLQPLLFKATTSKSATKNKSTAKKHSGNPAKITKSPKPSKSKAKPDADCKKQSSSKNIKSENSGKGAAKVKTEKSEQKDKKTKSIKDSSKSKGDNKVTDEQISKTSASRKSGRRLSKELPKGAYKDEQNDDIDVDNGDEYEPRADGDSDEDDGKKKKSRKGKGKMPVKKEPAESSVCEENSDSDFEEDSILIRTQKLRRSGPSSKNSKVLSSESESSPDSPKGSDSWIEVFLDKEERWICIDCLTGRLDKPYDIEHNTTQPLTYVLGIDNDGYIKDVTQRYASAWLTSTRKLRVEEEWWEETLAPYRNPNKKLDQREDQEIQGGLQKQPLPTSIGDFKSHPLYALQRHLLKFEAIYPPSAVPVGYIRGEPVFARECVYTLHSRENWLKEGRAVRIGEEAYKYVKSRPKWNRPKENPDAKDLEIYGIWQTEIYIPPPAVDTPGELKMEEDPRHLVICNSLILIEPSTFIKSVRRLPLMFSSYRGKVPRNSHGNVEMFMPSMLPAGTVHLKLPALNKIAKKLDIDCAPAMVGWDHHCGFSHPLMDGWIVCEEFKDILLAAWDEEQEIIKEKEAAKREKRVYDNWRKLIRGLLIRERLKKTYDLESEKKPEQIEKKPAKKEKRDSLKGDKSTTQEKATDVQYSWPQNRLNNKVTAFEMEEL